MRGPEGPPRAIIVGVGDELLYGQTVNTNGSWLGRELSDLGFIVLRQEVVGDSETAIHGAVTSGLATGDVVLFTGGLGPTPDDLTRPVVARSLGFGLEEDPVVLEKLRERFRALGYEEVPRNNRLMAQVPRGADVLPNPVGAAPGLVLEADGGKVVVLLPGIPSEMRGLFVEELAPNLGRRFGHRLVPVHHRILHTTGIAESLLATEMGHLLPKESGPVSLAFLPDLRGVRLRLTAEGLSQGEATRSLDELELQLEGILAPYRYRSEIGDLAEALGSALASTGGTLAVAESCTGGLIAKRITDSPGASRYFRGGVLAYADEVKTEQLGVPENLISTEGAVSPSVAEAMALGVVKRLKVTSGIGVTGIAGPEGGSEEKPVGTVCFGVVHRGTVSVRQQRFLGNREAVRERAAQAAMALLLRQVEGEGGDD